LIRKQIEIYNFLKLSQFISELHQFEHLLVGLYKNMITKKNGLYM